MSERYKSFTTEDCEKWKIDKTKNPKTGRKLKSNSVIIKELEKQCKEKKEIIKEYKENKFNERYNKYTTEDCEKWKKDKTKNPKTGRILKSNSIILKQLNKICNNNEDKDEEKKIKKKIEIDKEKEEKKYIIKKSILEHKLSKEECIKWINNKLENPRTNNKLNLNGYIYGIIEKQCSEYNLEKKKENKLKEIKEDILNDDEENEIFIRNKINKYKKNIKEDILNDDEENEIKEKIFILENKLKIKNKEKKISREKKKSKEKKNIIDENELYYPDLNDKDYVNKLNNLYEFNIYKIKKYEIIKNKEEFNKNTLKLCGEFEKTYYQQLISHYISNRTPYNSCLLYHGVGVGKTCSAITLSENLLQTHSQYEEPKIWVIMPSALRGSFKEQIFSIANFDDYKILANQCTGDTYIKMTQLLKNTEKDKAILKIKKFINNRYRLFTYDEFAKLIENEYENKILEDKVIIIDEAHNIRNSSKLEDKRIYTAISKALKDGINNKLILLSATPIYNEPTDILDLLYLFLLNDKRNEILKKINPPFENLFNNENKIKEDMKNLLEKLSNNYISYLRGKNPFTFAIKLNAKDNGFKILDKIIPNDPNNNPIPENDKNWLDKIEDGITLSKLTENQKKLIINKKDLNENNVLSNLQPMNIVYDDKTGSTGFANFFNRIDKTGTINVSYVKKYENALFPNKENLGLYSGKFLTISEFIRNSNGIVVIYSRFIEGGILPLAIILEHMGFMREGEKNILKNPLLIDNPPKYNFKNSPKYCIMTSHSDINNIMGSTSIDKLIPIINSNKNINGELIKVILMTPIASEGLSFYNTREMHILEPWYHFNKQKQIIGRGIRNCRHNSLPLEERNMTIFTHASFDNFEIETPDIHAYRISSKKLYQSDIIDKIIRDNAFDCYLMKNINYFPKDIFNFDIKLKTSQNKLIDYKYGDDKFLEPKCKIDNLKLNKLGFRKETYKNLIYNSTKLLKNLILDKLHNGIRFIHNDEIINILDLDIKIVYETINQSVYPNKLIDNFILITHNNGIHIIDINEKKPSNIRILFDKKQDIILENNNIIPDNLLLDIDYNNNNLFKNTISIYLSFNSNIYFKFINHIITSNYKSINNNDKYIAKCFFNQGALIHKNELKLYSNNNEIEYIGYYDIFNIDSDINIYNFNENRFKSLSKKNTDYIKIISNRNEIIIPNMEKEKLSSGIIIPKKIKDYYINNFKILSFGSTDGKKTGIVCESLLKPAQDLIIKEFDTDILKFKKTKKEKCLLLAESMFKINRLYLYPLFKPKF
jgi:hypothetical protein